MQKILVAGLTAAAVPVPTVRIDRPRAILDTQRSRIPVTFGHNEWRDCCFRAVETPSPLPWADDVFQSHCPFVSSQLLMDTHVAVWLPKYIGDRRLTIGCLLYLNQGWASLDFGDLASFERDAIFAATPEHSRWDLVFRGAIPPCPEEEAYTLPFQYEPTGVLSEVARYFLRAQLTQVHDVSQVWKRVTAGEHDVLMRIPEPGRIQFSQLQPGISTATGASRKAGHV